MTMRGAKVVWCLMPLLSAVVVDAQKDSKWSWSSNNRNNVDGVSDRLTNRRKYESLEDFRDRYEVNEHTTRKPNTQHDEFYGNGVGSGDGFGNNAGGYGFNGPNSVTGNGYNGNGFGAFVPQGLGGLGPNNFNNYPLYGNQFNGPYNPGFGYPSNNFKPGGPGFNNNFYPNGGFQPGINGINGPINNGYFPGGGYGPNRYPGAGYNPLGNSPANGILTGPGGPTGLYGRPPNYYGPNQLGFNGGGLGGFGGAPFNNGFNNNYGGGFNGIGGGGGGFPPNGIIPFNSKAGSGILADEGNEPKERTLDKKSNE